MRGWSRVKLRKAWEKKALERKLNCLRAARGCAKFGLTIADAATE